MEFALFKKKCTSIKNRGTNLTKDINDLVQDAIDSAMKHNDYNRAALVLTAMWSGRLYSASKTVSEYFKAHGPFVVEFDKTGGSFRVRKDKSETAIDFVTRGRVPYYSWEKPKVEASLSLDGAKKRFDMLMKQASEKLSDEDKSAFYNIVVARAKKLEETIILPDEEIQAPVAEAA